MKVAVSYLKSSYGKEETIKKINETSADLIHVDLMDGKFVEANNMNLEETVNLLKNATKPLDIHLMSEEVEIYLSELSKLHPEFITFHLEASCDTTASIQKIKEKGIKVGLAIKPETSVSSLTPYLKDIDLVLVMSVEPGRGGQKFLPITIEKLNELKKYQKDYAFQINVDGGINMETISFVKEKTDIVVSGSYVCESKNFDKQIQTLK